MGYWGALLMLFFLALGESVVLPLPPDPFLSALVVSYPEHTWLSTIACTSGSLIGGLIGYLVGTLVGKPLIPWLRRRFGLSASKVLVRLKRYGSWAVLLAAFTPLPFKVFTVLAGVLRVNLIGFLVAAAVGRSARFTGVALASLGFKELAHKEVLVLLIVIALLLMLAFYLHNKLNQVRGRASDG